MSAERSQKLHIHQRFCNRLAGPRMYLGQRRPMTAVFGFVQRVMNRHTMFASRLPARRRLQRYFSGLNFVFALPLVRVFHEHGAFTVSTPERLLASQLQAIRVFHTTRIKSILRQTGGVSQSPIVAPLQIVRQASKVESQHSTGHTPDIPNTHMNFLRSGKSILDLSQQRLVRNLSSIIRNIFVEKRPTMKGGESIQQSIQDWQRLGLPFVWLYAGSPRKAGVTKGDDVKIAPALMTRMPTANAEAKHGSHNQSFSDMQHLLAAQTRFRDFSPEKILSRTPAEKKNLLPATPPELIHKAYHAADGRSQAWPPGENENTNAEAVAQRRFKPIGIAEPPTPEAFKSIDHLADHVITIIEKRLQTERERRGIFA